jgi:hypothetical protein
MIVGSDSLLVQMAVELADKHPPSKGLGEEHWCLRCWAPWPCVAARHALEVCRAAGLGASSANRRDTFDERQLAAAVPAGGEDRLWADSPLERRNAWR